MSFFIKQTFVCFRVASYGRIYATDPYHALAPAAAYGVGAMVRTAAGMTAAKYPVFHYLKIQH